MTVRTCPCGATIAYAGRGRPRTRCESCRPRATRIRRRRPVRCAPTRPVSDVERLIHEHLWLLHRIAAAWARKGQLDPGDLAADGFIGLYQAAVRYDPAGGATFRTWATYRIDGAIRDALRQQDTVSRSDRKLMRHLTAARQRFLVREGRMPSRPELAAELAWTERELDRVQTALNRATVVPLDAPLNLRQHEDGAAIALRDLIADRTVDLERDVRLAESGDELRRLVTRLTPREQSVIGWYFWEDMRLRDIAPLLGVTESRVSQILTRALARLRNLAPDDLREAA